MDGLEFNKIAAAILAALLIAFGGSTLVYEVTKDHGHAKAGYDLGGAVGVASASSETETAKEEEKPIFEEVKPLLASASADDGAKVFGKCKACHTVNEGGANRAGPNLWEVVNRDKGAIDAFNYSTAMAEKEGEWTYEALAGFLHKPKDWLPGTKMGFAGLKKPEDLANVIAYLRSLSANPAELPQ
jgi:cytochrome c